MPAVLTEIRADGRATSFFGDLHPSFHGNVVKAMASAKQGYPIVSRMLAQGRARVDARDATRSSRMLDDELRATVDARRAADADDRRGRRRARRRRRAASGPASSTGCRISRRCARRRRRHAPGDGRPRAHRRVGRRASEGSSRRSCWRWAARPTCARCCSRASRSMLMGPTGTPTEIEAGRDRRAGRRRPRQRRAVLDRAGVPQRGLEGAVFRRLQEADRPLQGRARSRPPPTSSCGAATRRPASRRRGRRIARSSATSCEAMRAYASGALGAQADPVRRRATASSRSAPTG